MSFQSTVNRNFTTGFVGEIVRDGPNRTKAVRIAALTGAALTSAQNQGNVIGRVYGFVGEVPVTGTTLAALAPTVSVGGANYAGVLIHPKHYVLQGTALGGSLAASYVIADGSEAEVSDMNIIVAELANFTAASATITPGDPLAYVPNSISGANNPLGVGFGAIVSYPKGSTMPTGLVALPGTVSNSITLAASAAGAVVSGVTIIQLTN